MKTGSAVIHLLGAITGLLCGLSWKMRECPRWQSILIGCGAVMLALY